MLFISRRLLFQKSRVAHIIAFTKYNTWKKWFNLIQCYYEKKRKKTVLLSKPFLANTEPTNSCILHCPFCPTGKSNHRENGFANLMIYKKMMKELSDTLYLVTLHGWGEPLLHPKLPVIIQIIHQNRIATALTTNGLLLNTLMSEKLIESKLDIIYISIDGTTEESYRKYRVGGSFTKVIKNVENLVAMKKKKGSTTPFIEWQFIVFKHNEHEKEAARRLSHKIGVDNIVFLPAYTEDDRYKPTDPKMRLSQDSPLTKSTDCNHLWTTFSLHWNGNVVPCCYDYEEKNSFSDYLHTSFPALWNNPIFQTSREQVVTGTPDPKIGTPCYYCIQQTNYQSSLH